MILNLSTNSLLKSKALEREALYCANCVTQMRFSGSNGVIDLTPTISTKSTTADAAFQYSRSLVMSYLFSSLNYRL